MARSRKIRKHRTVSQSSQSEKRADQQAWEGFDGLAAPIASVYADVPEAEGMAEIDRICRV